jgi:hypothetical protein
VFLYNFIVKITMQCLYGETCKARSYLKEVGSSLPGDTKLRIRENYA